MNKPLHKIEKCNIYYEAWQIQCCGKPFRVGSRVKWTCAKADRDIQGYHIDLHEEHHGDEELAMVGHVVKILAMMQVFPNNLGCYEFDASQIILTELFEADGWESEPDNEDDNPEYIVFWGYMVTLENVEIYELGVRKRFDYR